MTSTYSNVFGHLMTNHQWDADPLTHMSPYSNVFGHLIPNHQWDADPLTHMSPYTNTILARQCIMFLKNFLKNLNNLLYQNPCLINLSVCSLCLKTKLCNVSHILLILLSCEMYTHM